MLREKKFFFYYILSFAQLNHRTVFPWTILSFYFLTIQPLNIQRLENAVNQVSNYQTTYLKYLLSKIETS